MNIKFEKYIFSNIHNQHFMHLFSSKETHYFDYALTDHLLILSHQQEVLYVEDLQKLKPVLDKRKSCIWVYR